MRKERHGGKFMRKWVFFTMLLAVIMALAAGFAILSRFPDTSLKGRFLAGEKVTIEWPSLLWLSQVNPRDSESAAGVLAWFVDVRIHEARWVRTYVLVQILQQAADLTDLGAGLTRGMGAHAMQWNPQDNSLTFYVSELYAATCGGQLGDDPLPVWQTRVEPCLDEAGPVTSIVQRYRDGFTILYVVEPKR